MVSKIIVVIVGIVIIIFLEIFSIDDIIIGNDNCDIGVWLVDVK